MKLPIKKKDIVEKCRRILYTGFLVDEDKEFLHELFKCHPDYNIKKGVGVVDFSRKKNIYGKMGFIFIRADGSSSDFSFMKCINPPKIDTKIRSACRQAIYPIISRFKRNHDLIVHHANISFDEIFKKWFKDNKHLDFSTNGNIDNNQTTYFLSQETSNSFIEYHQKVATLQEVSKEKHKQIHSKR